METVVIQLPQGTIIKLPGTLKIKATKGVKVIFRGANIKSEAYSPGCIQVSEIE